MKQFALLLAVLLCIFVCCSCGITSDNSEIEASGISSEASSEAAYNEPLKPLSGILALKQYKNDSKFTAELIAIDAESGNAETVRTFSFASKDYLYNYGEQKYWGSKEYSYIYDRFMFDANYERLALTAIDSVDEHTYCGWIDTNGEFHNVYLSLFEKDGDFETIHSEAIGFDLDDNFYFTVSGKLYSVPSVELGHDRLIEDAVFPYNDDGNKVSSYLPEKIYARVTDKSAQKYLVHIGYSTGSFIHNETTGSDLCMIDSDSGEVINLTEKYPKVFWDGIFSPDGNRIAFLCRNPSTDSNANLFISEIDNFNPQKINTGLDFTRIIIEDYDAYTSSALRKPEMYYYVPSDEGYSYGSDELLEIIDWK